MKAGERVGADARLPTGRQIGTVPTFFFRKGLARPFGQIAGRFEEKGLEVRAGGHDSGRPIPEVPPILFTYGEAVILGRLAVRPAPERGGPPHRSRSHLELVNRSTRSLSTGDRSYRIAYAVSRELDAGGRRLVVKECQACSRRFRRYCSPGFERFSDYAGIAGGRRRGGRSRCGQKEEGGGLLQRCYRASMKLIPLCFSVFLKSSKRLSLTIKSSATCEKIFGNSAHVVS